MPNHRRRRGPGRQRASPNSPEGIKRTEETLTALDLVKQGMSYREVGKAMGISYTKAHTLVTEELQRLRKECARSAEDHVHLQNERLEVMISSLWPRVLAGDTRSTEVCLKVLERQAKLLGLDAPEKQEISVEFTDLTDEELLEESRRHRIVIDHVAAPALLPGETPDSVPPEVLDAEVLRLVDGRHPDLVPDGEAPLLPPTGVLGDTLPSPPSLPGEPPPPATPPPDSPEGEGHEGPP